MAGFRTFATGEVLSAANVNDFLMKQSVMVFDDDAARTAALGAEVAEGMLTFNKDTGALEVFDGSDFVPAGAEPNLVAVKSAIFTGIQTNSTAGGANFSVTDLSITHALADASNKLIISASVGAAAQANFIGIGMAIHDGTGLIAVGASPGTRIATTAGGPTATNTEGNVLDVRVTVLASTFVHAPGDTTSRTYTLRLSNMSSDTQTIFVNRNTQDADNAGNPRAVSSLVIQEVKV